MNLLIIPDIDNIEESVRLADEWGLGFEYNDFYFPHVLDDRDELRRRIDIYKGIGRDRYTDTLHGAFLDIAVHSSDSQIAKVSSDRVHLCMDIASELGVRGVVFHTNIIPNFRTESYTDMWVERNAMFWKGILNEYSGINIYIENMFDSSYNELMALGNIMEDEKRFGVCLDYAHAVVFGNDAPGEWVRTLAPYIRHMHINDNDGVSDLHMSVGTGCIDWNAYNTYIKTYNITCSVLIEVTGCDRQRESLMYMKYNGLFPFFDNINI